MVMNDDDDDDDDGDDGGDDGGDCLVYRRGMLPSMSRCTNIVEPAPGCTSPIRCESITMMMIAMIVMMMMMAMPLASCSSTSYSCRHGHLLRHRPQQSIRSIVASSMLFFLLSIM